MMSEYIIINKTALEKRIEELENEYFQLKGNNDTDEHYLDGRRTSLKEILSQSTSLTPEIEKAIQFGKDIRSEKSFINENFGSPFVDYDDSTEETNQYISTLKIDL